MHFTTTTSGSVYLSCGQLNEAKAEFEQRATMQPEDALAAYATLGVIAWNQGDEGEAVRRFERALAVWDTAWERGLQTPATLWENKAIALLCLGKREAALQALQEARARLQRQDIVDFELYDFFLRHPGRPTDCMRRSNSCKRCSASVRKGRRSSEPTHPRAERPIRLAGMHLHLPVAQEPGHRRLGGQNEIARALNGREPHVGLVGRTCGQHEADLGSPPRGPRPAPPACPPPQTTLQSTHP